MFTKQERAEFRKNQPSRRDRKGEYERMVDRKPTSYKNREFVAWDGEGVEDKYVLMMNSKGSVFKGSNLSTEGCLLFLCSIGDMVDEPINVVFGGSYDVNMILKDLPPGHLLMLHQTHHVYYMYFRLEYIPRKYFRVSQYDHRVYGDKRKRKPIATTTLWDVIGFFQKSFVGALEEYFPLEEDRIRLGFDKIKAGKERRNDFSITQLEDFIIPYTFLEVTALVELMNKLRSHLLEANIIVKRWDGAGAVAAAVLSKYGVKRYYEDLPKEVEEIAQHAYGGGRVEMYKYGHTEETVYHYDLIGAYPSAMPRLPNLAGGQWFHVNMRTDVNMLTSRDINDYAMYKVYWDFRYIHNKKGRAMYNGYNLMYPFFYRLPWSEPRIYYPAHGYNWVWGPELSVAKKWMHKIGGEIIVLDRYQFIPSDDIKPFAFVNDLYKKRLELKRQGNGAQLAFKLGINSLYGKTAQTIGYQVRRTDDDGQIKLPPFYNLMYAGLITSYTRARMFDAMMQDPESIIAVATDGLWSTKPLNLDIGKNLGQWEFEKLSSFTSVQAGVYFAHTEDGKETYHYRGFNQGSIQEEDIIEAWRNKGFCIPIPTRRFVTLGSCVYSQERLEHKWRKWEDSLRLLEVFPSHSQKREGYVPDERAADMLLPTMPTPVMKFDVQVKNVNMLTDEFLSRRRPLPWENDMFSEVGAEERMIAWEIMDTETT